MIPSPGGRERQHNDLVHKYILLPIVCYLKVDVCLSTELVVLPSVAVEAIGRGHDHAVRQAVIADTGQHLFKKKYVQFVRRHAREKGRKGEREGQGRGGTGREGASLHQRHAGSLLSQTNMPSIFGRKLASPSPPAVSYSMLVVCTL